MESKTSELILRTDPDKTICECTTDVKPDYVIVGFPGHGLVGNIAAKHMIKELKLEWIGSIRSPLIPPVSVFIDGVLAYPYRIYGCKDKNLVILIGESPCPPQAYYYLAHAMLEWAISLGVKQVICLDGFIVEQGSEEFNDVFLVGEPQIYEENVEFIKHNFKKPHTGFISGLSGAIMNEALLTRIQGLTLLAAINTPYPDPGGAAKLIEAVNKVKGFSIDTTKLISDAKQIQKSMLELAERNRQVSEQEIVGPRRGLYV